MGTFKSKQNRVNALLNDARRVPRAVLNTEHAPKIEALLRQLFSDEIDQSVLRNYEGVEDHFLVIFIPTYTRLPEMSHWLSDMGVNCLELEIEEGRFVYATSHFAMTEEVTQTFKPDAFATFRKLTNEQIDVLQDQLEKKSHRVADGEALVLSPPPEKIAEPEQEETVDLDYLHQSV